MITTRKHWASIERIISNFLRKNKQQIIFSIDKICVAIIRSSLYFYNISSTEEVDRIMWKIYYDEVTPFKNLMGCFRPSEFDSRKLVVFEFNPIKERLEHLYPFSFGNYSITNKFTFTEGFFISLVKEIITW